MNAGAAWGDPLLWMGLLPLLSVIGLTLVGIAATLWDRLRSAWRT